MPYIIAVLALVVIGTGFALLQKQEVSPDIPILSTESSTETEVTRSTTTADTALTATPSLSIQPEETPTQTNDTSPKNTKTPSTPTTPAPSTLTTPAPADTNRYTNGTYRTQSTYRTPEGTYTMDVTLVITDDSVSSASLSFDADGARSGYSKRFNSGYQSQVIGKDLEGMNLSRVSGASLTTNAFNKALNTIRSQAS